MDNRKYLQLKFIESEIDQARLMLDLFHRQVQKQEQKLRAILIKAEERKIKLIESK